MDVGPTLAKGHPRSLDHGCNVRSTCRCSVYPAIHTTTRSLLRSSSTHEPSDPPLRVVLLVVRLHEGDAISGLRLCYPRKSPPIWGGRRNPLNGLFGAGGRPGEAVRWRPVDPTRRRLAPWFDRVAVSPSLSGSLERWCRRALPALSAPESRVGSFCGPCCMSCIWRPTCSVSPSARAIHTCSKRRLRCTLSSWLRRSRS